MKQIRKHIASIQCIAILLNSMVLGAMFMRAVSFEGLHYITDIRGEVGIKRSFWFGYRQASVGDVVNSSDRLRVNDSSSARIRCSNLDIWEASPGIREVSEGCFETQEVSPASREDFAPSRQGGGSH